MRIRSKFFTSLVVRIAAAVTVSTLVSSLGLAQVAAPVKEESPGLLARAKVSPDSARRIAMSRVPTGTIKSAEIEVENRVLVYSFDIAVPRRSGIEEVLVNAMTGAVVSQEHEGPKAEAAERAQDRRDARARLVAPTRKP